MMDEDPVQQRALTLEDLRKVLDSYMGDTFPVTASYDAGCAEGDVVAVREENGRIVLEID